MLRCSFIAEVFVMRSQFPGGHVMHIWFVQSSHVPLFSISSGLRANAAQGSCPGKCSMHGVGPRSLGSAMVSSFRPAVLPAKSAIRSWPLRSQNVVLERSCVAGDAGPFVFLQIGRGFIMVRVLTIFPNCLDLSGCHSHLQRIRC